MSYSINIGDLLCKPAGTVIAMPDGKNLMTNRIIFRIQSMRYMITSANGTLAMCNDIVHVQAKKVKFQLKNTLNMAVVFLSGSSFFTLTFTNDGKII